MRDTTTTTSVGTGSGVHRMKARTDADASSRSAGVRPDSSLVRGRPRRACTSSALASAATGCLFLDQVLANDHTVGDGVARGEHHIPDVHDAFKVGANLHQASTVATIEATGFTRTGRAIAFACTHMPIGSLVLYAPTAIPG